MIRRDLTAEGAEGAEKMAMQSLKIGDRVISKGRRGVPLAAVLKAGAGPVCGVVLDLVRRPTPAQMLVGVLWDGMDRRWTHWACELLPAETKQESEAA